MKVTLWNTRAFSFWPNTLVFPFSPGRLAPIATCPSVRASACKRVVARPMLQIFFFQDDLQKERTPTTKTGWHMVVFIRKPIWHGDWFKTGFSWRKLDWRIRISSDSSSQERLPRLLVSDCWRKDSSLVVESLVSRRRALNYIAGIYDSKPKRVFTHCRPTRTMVSSFENSGFFLSKPLIAHAEPSPSATATPGAEIERAESTPNWEDICCNPKKRWQKTVFLNLRMVTVLRYVCRYLNSRCRGFPAEPVSNSFWPCVGRKRRIISILSVPINRP